MTIHNKTIYTLVKKVRHHLQMIQTCIATIAFQTTPQIQKTQMTPTRISRQNTLLYIHKENMHTEILFATHTYSIMILIIKTYTALLQQELQNPYWNLHDPIATKSYQISKDMDIETMPHAMYFTGDSNTITKINQVPYQTIEYNDNGMFTMKLMNDMPIKIFIDNDATPSILPLCTYNKLPIYIHILKPKARFLYIQEEV